ncbi:MAG TPA: bifunctional RNase H/acid phosphatase [Jatrophihabitantaceae bacterium]|jgi:broad specificity phosphatase PhoE/ribonuclease HI|nr:bifunctional RNase H/acid phosphatase [Jatrophihabitantaceae bacterium]
MNVVVEADGGSRGNPGPAGYGAVVLDPATGTVLAERNEHIGRETNNVAEYRGLIAGLQAARELGADQVSVRMDSKLVVEQMSGRWQIKHEGLRPLARQAAELRDSFTRVTFEWIPREQNKHADRLANDAMDRAADKPVREPAAAPIVAGPSWMPPTGPRTRMLLVRHGATVHSADRRFSGRNDLPLDAVGQAQAVALAQRRFPDAVAVVSSPIRRAAETAQVIADALGLAVQINNDFAELDFGVFEGLSLAEARERYPDELTAWTRSPDVAPPGGESLASLTRRVRRGRDAVIATFPDATVLVVTHVTPIKMLVRAALDAPVSSIYRMHLNTASVTTIDYLADGSSSLRLFNETSHVPST